MLFKGIDRVRHAGFLLTQPVTILIIIISRIEKDYIILRGSYTIGEIYAFRCFGVRWGMQIESAIFIFFLA